ncbi:hypothetical protein [Halomonas sp. JS92-SW72]|uniref:hypothetical protein n=1 Tax=Halomonas sp. JS92-SW72 TaxID=2306583 RepID=UPI0013C2D0B3|nr:hypothetical protein [Halomonas sp. JS92-SW72]
MRSFRSVGTCGASSATGPTGAAITATATGTGGHTDANCRGHTDPHQSGGREAGGGGQARQPTGRSGATSRSAARGGTTSCGTRACSGAGSAGTCRWGLCGRGSSSGCTRFRALG